MRIKKEQIKFFDAQTNTYHGCDEFIGAQDEVFQINLRKRVSELINTGTLKGTTADYAGAGAWKVKVPNANNEYAIFRIETNIDMKSATALKRPKPNLQNASVRVSFLTGEAPVVYPNPHDQNPMENLYFEVEQMYAKLGLNLKEQEEFEFVINQVRLNKALSGKHAYGGSYKVVAQSDFIYDIELKTCTGREIKRTISFR